MILTTSAHGPSYSTDSTASDISRFAATRHLLQSSTPRAYATQTPGTFEELYPALFAEPQHGGFTLALDACRAMFDGIVATIARPLATRNAERASRVARAISSRYAPKA